jgi:hypothetical protein
MVDTGRNWCPVVDIDVLDHGAINFFLKSGNVTLKIKQPSLHPV